jgi:hypothetical protein
MIKSLLSVTELETQHRTLDKQIRRIERRGPRMTLPDQRQVAELKKVKLALKDQLFTIKSRAS